MAVSSCWVLSGGVYCGQNEAWRGEASSGQEKEGDLGRCQNQLEEVGFEVGGRSGWRIPEWGTWEILLGMRLAKCVLQGPGASVLHGRSWAQALGSGWRGCEHLPRRSRELTVHPPQ